MRAVLRVAGTAALSVLGVVLIAATHVLRFFGQMVGGFTIMTPPYFSSTDGSLSESARDEPESDTDRFRRQWARRRNTPSRSHPE